MKHAFEWGVFSGFTGLDMIYMTINVSLNRGGRNLAAAPSHRLDEFPVSATRSQYVWDWIGSLLRDRP